MGFPTSFGIPWIRGVLGAKSIFFINNNKHTLRIFTNMAQDFFQEFKSVETYHI